MSVALIPTFTLVPYRDELPSNVEVMERLQTNSWSAALQELD